MMILLVNIASSIHKPDHEGEKEKEKEKEPKELGDVKSKNIDSTNETKIKTEFDLKRSEIKYTTIEFTHYRNLGGATYIYTNVDGVPHKWIMSTADFEKITSK